MYIMEELGKNKSDKLKDQAKQTKKTSEKIQYNPQKINTKEKIDNNELESTKNAMKKLAKQLWWIDENGKFIKEISMVEYKPWINIYISSWDNWPFVKIENNIAEKIIINIPLQKDHSIIWYAEDTIITNGWWEVTTKSKISNEEIKSYINLVL